MKYFKPPIILIGMVVMVVLALPFGLKTREVLMGQYHTAITEIANGNYNQAIDILNEIGPGYQNSNFYVELARNCDSYEKATLAMMANQYEKALTEFIRLDDFYDSSQKATECLQKLKE